MKIITMKSRNPVVVALAVLVVLGALAVVFTLGVILLGTLAIAGTLIGAGFIIRSKLTRGSRMIDKRSVRARLDPSLEVQPVRKQLPPPEGPPPD